MKQKLTLILALSLLATSGFSQKSKRQGADREKGPLFGLHYNMADYVAPLGIKDPSTGKVYQKMRDMDKGFSLSYMKGINPHIDWAVKVNVMFRDYSAYNSGQTQKTDIGAELEPSIMLRAFDDRALMNPYLTVGIGGGLYTDEFGAYVPAGIGLQVNLNSQTYLFVQGAYRWTLTKDIFGDNLQYSIGFAQNIGKEKVVPPPPPPPPPPVVEAPKDRDGDGILDVDDRCPDVKGSAALKGCPDRDGDGIADIDDKCPDVAGLARYQGCPIPDTDKDGVNDEVDKCPTVPGFARYEGCPIPDTDGDGVNDEEDKCPKRPGVKDNYGCPVIGIKSYEVVYKTNSAVLLPQGKLRLDSVARYLANNPEVTVTVDGHTDNTGSDKINDPLSIKRAEAAKKYIASKGIDPARMITAGYGSKQPTSDNKTAEGRRKNRRIEIKIKD